MLVRLVAQSEHLPVVSSRSFSIPVAWQVAPKRLFKSNMVEYTLMIWCLM